MTTAAPSPFDVLDFQFKLHCRLNIFDVDSDDTFNNVCSMLACASRYGLIFVGTRFNNFQVIQQQDIVLNNDKEFNNYPRRIVKLPSAPHHLSVNCDCTKLGVVVERDGCATAIIYDVLSFMKQSIVVIKEIRLSPTPNIKVLQTDWNPAIPDIFTACKNDGSLGVYEFKGQVLDIHEIPQTAANTCFCWSPKGKQIAVGSKDGKITQYKPDLKLVKSINPPVLNGNYSIISLQWASSFQFIGIYKSETGDTAASKLIVIDAPKAGITTYTNYEDVCYSYGNVRPYQFYLILEQHWNILFVSSSNGSEVGVLGLDGIKWMQWALEDSSRAELPLSRKKQETFSIGLAINTGYTKTIISGDKTLPPAPALLILSNHGVLCCFDILNMKPNAPSVCSPPEAIADKSGLSQFITTETLIKPTHKETPKPTVAVASTPSLIPPKAALFPAPFNSNNNVNLQHGIPQSVSTKPTIQASFNSLNKESHGPTVEQKAFAVKSQDDTVILKTISKVADVDSSSSTKSNDRIPINVETEAMIAELVREECLTLESELKGLLYRGRKLKVDIGNDNEASIMTEKIAKLEEFVKAVKETSHGQAAEIHALKQSVIQAWAWYEEARSRYANNKDPTLLALQKVQPLDPASQRYLENLNHLIHYLDSQIIQANKSLDEQWDYFQDSLRKTKKIRMPTIETIYQSMVKQSGTLQKQRYILKDISSRINTYKKTSVASNILISLDEVDNVAEELNKLQVNSAPNNSHYSKLYERQTKLTAEKSQKLFKFLTKRNATHIAVSKPILNNSTIHLNSLLQPAISDVENEQPLAEPLSPIAHTKKTLPQKMDFVMSTPKPVSATNMPFVSAVQPMKPLNKFVSVNQNTDLFKNSAKPIPTFGVAKSTNAGFNFTNKTSTTAGHLETGSAITSKSLIVSTMPPASPSSFTFTSIVGSTMTSNATTTNFKIPPIVSTVGTGAAPGKSSASMSSCAFVSTSSSNIFGGNTNPAATGILKMSANITPIDKPVVTQISSFGIAQVSKSITNPNDIPTLGYKVTLQTGISTSKSSLFGSSTSSQVSGSTGQPQINVVSTVGSISSTSAAAPTIFGNMSTLNSQIATNTTPWIGTSKTTSNIFGGQATNTPQTFGTQVSLINSTVTGSVSSTSGCIFAPQSALPLASTTANSAPLNNKSTSSTSTTAMPAQPIVTSPLNSEKSVSVFGASSSTATLPANTTNSSTTSSIFGSSSIFGNSPQTNNQSTALNLTVSNSASSNIFGTSTKTFGSKLSFGTTPASAVSSFGTPSGIIAAASTNSTSSTQFATSTTVTSSKLFGTTSLTSQNSASTTTLEPVSTNTTTLSTSTIAVSPFGTASTTISTVSPFGTSTTTTGITPILGATTTIVTATSPFGKTATNSTTASPFGTVATSSTTASPFATTATTSTAASPFATTATTSTAASPFATTAATTTAASPFGTQTTAVTSVSQFGAPSATTTTASPFGAPSATTTTASPFGAPSATTTTASPFGAVTTTTGSPFGAPLKNTTSASPFGTNSPSVFGSANNQSAFGTAAPTTSTSIFGGFVSKDSTNTNVFGGSTRLFGQGTTTTTSAPAFGAASPFGAPTSSTSSFGTPSPFGVAATTNANTFGAPSPFGSKPSPFGSVTTSTDSVFGQPSTFGSSGSSIFGGNTTTTTNSVFGSVSSNTFGTATTSASPFGGGSVFASNTGSTGSPFGGTSPFGQQTQQNFGNFSGNKQTTFSNSGSFGNGNTNSFSFNNLNMGATPTTSTGFGQTSANPFGRTNEQKFPAFSSANLFGSASTTPSSSTFGGSSVFSKPAFGSTSSGFGSPSFNQSSFSCGFGNPGSFSAGGQSVQQSGFGSPGFQKSPNSGGFGSPPVFGSSSPGFGAPPSFGGSPAFGATSTFGSPPKVFGGTTTANNAFATSQNANFGNLANQSTLGFGNLAQQQTSSQPSGFTGGSSFSSWR